VNNKFERDTDDLDVFVDELLSDWTENDTWDEHEEENEDWNLFQVKKTPRQCVEKMSKKYRTKYIREDFVER